MREVATRFLPKDKPTAIVMLSAHWESDPVKITSHPNPPMYYDYYGFPPESYKYQYPAPGSPVLAERIQRLLQEQGLESELDDQRGYDHGVFIPLMLMYPDANIPVVAVSLHRSLDVTTNMQIGAALQPLRDDGMLIVGSGYTFHNLKEFFNPSQKTYQMADQFNKWLKESILGGGDWLAKLQTWKEAPGARVAHPREEHLMPLFMVAAAGGADSKPQLIYDTEHPDCDLAVSAYLFQ